MNKSNQNPLLQHMEWTFANCLEIARAKNADYAGEQSDPFYNFSKANDFAGVTTEQGIMVRLTDKFSRVGNLLKREAAVKDEAITDTINDAINYLAILKAFIEMHPKKCNGDCGMNYCDENGCMERKRNLVGDVALNPES